MEVVGVYTAEQALERVLQQDALNMAAREGDIKLAQEEWRDSQAAAEVVVKVRRSASDISPGFWGSERDEMRDCPFCNVQHYSDCTDCSEVSCDCCRQHKWCDRCCAPFVTPSLIEE